MEFVTLWSKSSYSGTTLWVVERTHTADYIAATVGIRSMDEIVLINGRYYAIFKPNTNPNEATI
jgi:hypothetical protein